MSDLIPFTSSLSMTSREIAEMVGKRHDNVKRTIETLVEKSVIRTPKIEFVDIINNLGATIKREVYVFSLEDKRDSIVVVAQLSPEFTGRLVDRWQELEAKSSVPALPDFTDPVAAARAWADAKEGEQLALAQTRALTQQLETDRPYTDLARAITGQSTMTRRDWCALMKTDHGMHIGERELTAWLIESGYCYRDALTKDLRAYANHAALFKLEVHVISGFPRKLLMVTGDGVFQLTPIVVAAFSQEDAA